MALNIKNQEVEALAAEVAGLAHESKTEAIRRALLERRQRLEYATGSSDRYERWMRFLREEMWPDIQGISAPTPEEEAEILVLDNKSLVLKIEDTVIINLRRLL